MAEQIRLVIVGNGMVGHKFLDALATHADRAQYHVTVIGEEGRVAYDRVQLSAYFSGKTADDLSLVEPGFYEQQDYQVHLNQQVVSIDRTAKVVETQNGDKVAYDKLILATGSYPFVPPIPGKDRDGCLVYRTIEDLDDIIAAAKGGKVGTVVGGGLLGLEAAKALHDLGLETHVVEFAPRLMAVQVDDGGGTILRDKIESLSVQVHTGKNTKNITDGEQTAHKMEFADGESLETDVIVFSAGIRPRDR